MEFEKCVCCGEKEIHLSNCICQTLGQFNERTATPVTLRLHPRAFDPPWAPLQNDCILRAARGLRTEKVPVWFMRQAGLYLPEYRELKEKHSFSKIIHTPSLACEVTMQPVLRFDLDAAIIFSDLLVIPEALGMEVRTRLDHLDGDERDWCFLINPLSIPFEIGMRLNSCDLYRKLKYVYDAIRLTRHKLKGRVPVIGFAGAPWTLMCYMIEGENSKTMSKAKSWLYKWPEKSHELLRMLMHVVAVHLANQIQAGAQLLQLYEPNAEYLTPYLFVEFSWYYIKELKKLVAVEAEKRFIRMVPMILYVKGSALVIDLMKPFKYDCLSVDWTVIPSEVRRYIPREIALQGNIDPPALTGNRRRIKYLVKKMLKGFGVFAYIANLGHGIYPDVPPENVAYFVDLIHSLSEKIMAKKIAKEWDPDYYPDRKIPQKLLYRESTPDWYPGMDPSEMLLNKYF